MEGGGVSVVLLTFLHDALSQSLSDENADISYWIGGEAEQTGQEVLAELLHGHAVLLYYSLQETHQSNHTHAIMELNPEQQTSLEIKVSFF